MIKNCDINVEDIDRAEQGNAGILDFFLGESL